MNRPPKDHPAAPAADYLASMIASDLRPRAPLTSQAVHAAAKFFEKNPAAENLICLAERLDGRFVAIEIDAEGARKSEFRVIWNFGR